MSSKFILQQQAIHEMQENVLLAMLTFYFITFKYINFSFYFLMHVGYMRQYYDCENISRFWPIYTFSALLNIKKKCFGYATCVCMYVCMYVCIRGGLLQPLHLDPQWSIVLNPYDRWGWLWSNWWNENWQGKPKYSEETCPGATLSTTKSHMTDPVSNPGPQRWEATD
jgi:hypothetical protein